MAEQLSLGFAEGTPNDACRHLWEGVTLLAGFALADQAELLRDLAEVSAAAPFRHLRTPGGFRMSVAMTNCGAVGWVVERGAYRYAERDPESGRPWPPLPASFHTLALAAAVRGGYEGFTPDVCLVNRYEPGARMTLHVDQHERDLGAPVVSVSFGLPAVFLLGGRERSDTTERVPLNHGDVLVWGGPARLRYHGVLPVKHGKHAILGAQRINLTFRSAR